MLFIGDKFAASLALISVCSPLLALAEAAPAYHQQADSWQEKILAQFGKRDLKLSTSTPTASAPTPAAPTPVAPGFSPQGVVPGARESPPIDAIQAGKKKGQNPSPPFQSPSDEDPLGQGSPPHGPTTTSSVVTPTPPPAKSSTSSSSIFTPPAASPSGDSQGFEPPVSNLDQQNQQNQKNSDSLDELNQQNQENQRKMKEQKQQNPQNAQNEPPSSSASTSSTNPATPASTPQNQQDQKNSDLLDELNQQNQANQRKMKEQKQQNPQNAQNEPPGSSASTSSTTPATPPSTPQNQRSTPSTSLTSSSSSSTSAVPSPPQSHESPPDSPDHDDSSESAKHAAAPHHPEPQPPRRPPPESPERQEPAKVQKQPKKNKMPPPSSSTSTITVAVASVSTPPGVLSDSSIPSLPSSPPVPVPGKGKHQAPPKHHESPVKPIPKPSPEEDDPEEGPVGKPNPQSSDNSEKPDLQPFPDSPEKERPHFGPPQDSSSTSSQSSTSMSTPTPSPGVSPSGSTPTSFLSNARQGVSTPPDTSSPTSTPFLPLSPPRQGDQPKHKRPGIAQLSPELELPGQKSHSLYSRSAAMEPDASPTSDGTAASPSPDVDRKPFKAPEGVLSETGAKVGPDPSDPKTPSPAKQPLNTPDSLLPNLRPSSTPDSSDSESPGVGGKSFSAPSGASLESGSTSTSPGLNIPSPGLGKVGELSPLPKGPSGASSSPGPSSSPILGGVGISGGEEQSNSDTEDESNGNGDGEASTGDKDSSNDEDDSSGGDGVDLSVGIGGGPKQNNSSGSEQGGDDSDADVGKTGSTGGRPLPLPSPSVDVSVGASPIPSFEPPDEEGGLEDRPSKQDSDQQSEPSGSGRSDSGSRTTDSDDGLSLPSPNISPDVPLPGVSPTPTPSFELPDEQDDLEALPDKPSGNQGPGRRPPGPVNSLTTPPDILPSGTDDVLEPLQSGGSPLDDSLPSPALSPDSVSTGSESSGTSGPELPLPVDPLKSPRPEDKDKRPKPIPDALGPIVSEPSDSGASQPGSPRSTDAPLSPGVMPQLSSLVLGDATASDTGTGPLPPAIVSPPTSLPTPKVPSPQKGKGAVDSLLSPLSPESTEGASPSTSDVDLLPPAVVSPPTSTPTPKRPQEDGKRPVDPPSPAESTEEASPPGEGYSSPAGQSTTPKVPESAPSGAEYSKPTDEPSPKKGGTSIQETGDTEAPSASPTAYQKPPSDDSRSTGSPSPKGASGTSREASKDQGAAEVASATHPSGPVTDATTGVPAQPVATDASASPVPHPPPSTTNPADGYESPIRTLDARPSPPPSPSPEAPEEPHSIKPSGTNTYTSQPLESSLLVAPSTHGPKSPGTQDYAPLSKAPPSLPSNVPQIIQPPGGMPEQPENTTLVQVGFYQQLNFIFVANHPESANQIFGYLPKGISYGLNIEIKNVTMHALQPYNTAQEPDYITTLALAYIPSPLVNTLSLNLRTPVSQIYQNPKAPVKALMDLVNPTVPILAGPDVNSYGGNGFGDSGPRDTDRGQNEMGNSGGTVRGTSVGIGVGVVCGAAVYGAAMFYVARRYKKRRQRHSRSSSVPQGSALSPSTAPGSMGGAAIMSGGRGGYTDRPPSASSHGSSSRGSGGRSTARQAGISRPVMAENSLGFS
ncbi:MAG: hypothetical protein M1831_005123 [Alyxoria varia]|nr:MAG: hypothetical protein M1831_005123 [Alyxoria varia]